MGADLLFGLDMLESHQACVDLEKNMLRIRGREVMFLDEHELPEKVRTFEVDQAQEPDFRSPGSGSSASHFHDDTPPEPPNLVWSRPPGARHQSDVERQWEVDRLVVEPSDVEAQRKVKKATVLEDMEYAMEYAPDPLERVMLYSVAFISQMVCQVVLTRFMDSASQSRSMAYRLRLP